MLIRHYIWVLTILCSTLFAQNQSSDLYIEIDSLNKQIVNYLDKEVTNIDLIKVLEKRKMLVSKFLKNNINDVDLSFMINEQYITRLPARFKKYIEKESSYSGQIGVIINDEFKKNKSTNDYLLTTDSLIYRIQPSNNNINFLNNNYNKRVELSGIELGNNLFLTDKSKTIEIYDNTLLKTSVDGISEIKIAVILIRYADPPTDLYSNQELYDKLFSDNNVINNWIEEQSYGNA